MSVLLEEVESANRLIMFAMAPRSTPATNAEYGELFTRYGQDPGFREVVRAAARGMQIEILSQTVSTGLLLLPFQGGLFSPSMDSFRRGMQFRERVNSVQGDAHGPSRSARGNESASAIFRNCRARCVLH